MSRVGVAVLVLLVASLGANIYLLTRGTATPETKPPATAEHREIAPIRVLKPGATPTTPIVIPAAYATLDRAALEKRLAETETKLEKYLPLKEKYEREPRSPETEARARKILDKVFGELSSSKHAYDIECHGAYCKLDVVDDISTNDWMSAVQGNFAFHGWSFGRDGAYTSLPDPAEAARGQLMSDIIHGYIDSPGIATCSKDATSAPAPVVHIALDATRKLRPTIDSPLAEQPAGVCLRKELDDILRHIDVPGEITSMPEMPLPFPVPPH